MHALYSAALIFGLFVASCGNPNKASALKSEPTRNAANVNLAQPAGATKNMHVAVLDSDGTVLYKEDVQVQDNGGLIDLKYSVVNGVVVFSKKILKIEPQNSGLLPCRELTPECRLKNKEWLAKPRPKPECNYAGDPTCG